MQELAFIVILNGPLDKICNYCGENITIFTIKEKAESGIEPETFTLQV